MTAATEKMVETSSTPLQSLESETEITSFSATRQESTTPANKSTTNSLSFSTLTATTEKIDKTPSTLFGILASETTSLNAMAQEFTPPKKFNTTTFPFSSITAATEKIAETSLTLLESLAGPIPSVSAMAHSHESTRTLSGIDITTSEFHAISSETNSLHVSGTSKSLGDSTSVNGLTVSSTSNSLTASISSNDLTASSTPTSLSPSSSYKSLPIPTKYTSPSPEIGIYFGASKKTVDTWDITFPKHLATDSPETYAAKCREHQALLSLISTLAERRILGDQILLWRAIAGGYKVDHLSSDRIERIKGYSAEGEDLANAYNGPESTRLAFLAGNTRASVEPNKFTIQGPAATPEENSESEEEL